MITAPVAASDPNVDTVVIGNQVTVVCSAKESTVAGAKPVDPSTVKIAMLDATGALVKSVNGTTTANTDEYSAPFVLTSAANGPISFTCAASDTATPVHQGSDQVDTLLDLGPTIVPAQPVTGSAHNLLAPMDVEFTVTAAPVTAGDTQADVSGVTLHVGGQSITDVTAKGGGLYQASVNFNDGAIFTSPPSGPTPVVITASNKRGKPGKATNTLSYNFILDGIGPVITLTTPLAGAVIGPAAILSFTVVDPGSGVDSSTVQVKLNDQPHPYAANDPLWTVDAGSGTYTYKMGNTLSTDTIDSQVTVDVLASDNAGNASKGNSRLFNLDTHPPIVDLDPPPTYFERPGTAQGTTQCSDLFDPVGSAAPSDLAKVVNFGFFRSLVWDTTNAKAGQQVFFFALADQSSVRLYVQPDVTKPLLRDVNGDGVCDEIWTGSIPNQKNPGDAPLQFVALTALPSETSPSGTLDWAETPALAPTDAVCAAGSVTPRTRLCNGQSDLSILLHHTVVKTPHEPVVYAVQPDVGSSTSPICTGGQWDVAAAISTAMTPPMPKLGWVCVAARALDTVGNVGISAPLRICLDDGTHGATPCAGTPPPSCTDSCTAPPHFQVPHTAFAGYN